MMHRVYRIHLDGWVLQMPVKVACWPNQQAWCSFLVILVFFIKVIVSRLTSRVTARVRPYNTRADQAESAFVYCTGAPLRSPWFLIVEILDLVAQLRYATTNEQRGFQVSEATICA